MTQLVQASSKRSASKPSSRSRNTARTAKVRVFEGLRGLPSAPPGNRMAAVSRLCVRLLLERFHVDDATLTAMLRATAHEEPGSAQNSSSTFSVCRGAAVPCYLNSNTITTSWQPYVKNFAPNHSFDYGPALPCGWIGHGEDEPEHHGHQGVVTYEMDIRKHWLVSASLLHNMVLETAPA